MNTIIWEDPPSRNDHGKWSEIATELRRNPMRWGKIATMKTSTTATLISVGRLKDFRPRGSFEARSRRNGDHYDIYARFVGERSDQ